MNSEVKIVDAWCVNFFKMYDEKNGALFNLYDKVGE